VYPEARGYSRWRDPRFILLVLVVLMVAFVGGRELLIFYLNCAEFGDLYTRPIYYEVLGGLILSFIAFFRLDFKGRRSMCWWLLRIAKVSLRGRVFLESLPPEYFDYEGFRMPTSKFLMWQLTKVLIGIPIFANLNFGLAITQLFSGNTLGCSYLPKLFALPFINPPLSGELVEGTVIPLMPCLTLLIPPLLMAVGIRLLLLVGLNDLVRVFSPMTLGHRLPTMRGMALIEKLIAIGVLWTVFNMFFSSYIDYNTKYVICFLGAVGVFIAYLAVRDRMRRLAVLTRRDLITRIGIVILLLMALGTIMVVNNSIADARKLEWRGPYVTQQIYVNRYLAELGGVKELPFNYTPPAMPSKNSTIDLTLLDKTRLWDWEAAFSKLKPEIGLIPYLDFEDSDILRFNGSLYWCASVTLKLPPTVTSEDVWYNEHVYYTHAPTGFFMLDAHAGEVVDSSEFFKQRMVYYGEGGLFRDTWVAFPKGKGRGPEVGGHMYQGKGGIDVSPPLSWFFEPNFFFAFRDRTVHVIRYRDIHQRISLLMPYFELFYPDQGRYVDAYPVTDGKSTYWLVPLIWRLDTEKVPWSVGNPMKRLFGYALIDVYDGDLKIIALGDDFFSNMLKDAYRDYVTTEVPDWLRDQLRYPEELFEWRVDMYNFYHVTDPLDFIASSKFYEVPEGLNTYYIISRPPGFKAPEFVGLLSLELRGAGGKNLAGYVVVRNDYPYLGELYFYKVPETSKIKLLGPAGVLEALKKNPDYAKLETLLATPRIGDRILYTIGGHDVYVIPVYTKASGGVVSEMGVIAVVGATFTGKYYIGLGQTVEEAFSSYLGKVAGEELIGKKLPLSERVGEVERIFESHGFKVLEPEGMNPNVSFLDGQAVFVTKADRERALSLAEGFAARWEGETDKVLKWVKGELYNYGVMVNDRGIVELHYISIRMPE